jgi:DNA polymerase III gamma/tau subunit
MSVEKSLALKYRPKKLSEVIGQPVVVRAFSNAFKTNTLHHAYILAGNFGTGKTTMARIIAATENCKKGGKDPCGECSNCKDIFSGKSIEVKEMDAGSGGKVDDIRELHKSLYQYPVECKTKYVIIDECLDGPTRINTSEGLISIKDIVKNRMKVDVLSYNESSGKTEYKPITGWFKNSGKRIYKLAFETPGRIYASGGHLICTPDGYKKVDDLEVGDYICREGAIFSHYQEQMVYGSLMGDASIGKSKSKAKRIKRGTTPRLRFRHGTKQEQYLLFKQNLINDMVAAPSKKCMHVGWEGCDPITTFRFNSLTDRSLVSVYNTVIKDRKRTISKEWLEKIDWAGLAFWFMDDGSCNTYFNKDGTQRWSVRFHTYAFTLEEHELLKEFLEESFGLKCSIHKDNRCNGYMIDLGVESSEKLLRNISKYIPDCMRYKLHDMDSDEFDVSLLDSLFHRGVVVEKITEKSFLKDAKVTYDIEVEDNHNYFASNVLVHNCHSLTGQAAEASLKMIEEPPPFVRFILCIEENQKVYTKNKKFIKIKDVEPGNLIFTEEGFSSVKNKFYKGKSDVYDLRTKGGAVIKLTDSHKIRVFNGDKIVWKSAKDIAKSDYIPVFNKKEDKIENINDKELDYFKDLCHFEQFHSLTKVGESKVYDLEMDNDSHSFIVNGFSVHNCTTEPQAFKPTIHSRCILWSFNKVSWPELFDHLKMVADKEKLNYDEKALQVAAKYSKGSVRNALQHLQTMINYAGEEKITADLAREALGVIDNNLYFDLIDAIITKDMVKAFLTINMLFRDGKDARIVVDGMYEHLNNLIVERTCRQDIDKFDLTQEEVKKLAHQNGKLKGPVVLKMMSFCEHISFNLEYSVNPARSFNKFAVESIQLIRAYDSNIGKK